MLHPDSDVTYPAHTPVRDIPHHLDLRTQSLGHRRKRQGTSNSCCFLSFLKAMALGVTAEEGGVAEIHLLKLAVCSGRTILSDKRVAAPCPQLPVPTKVVSLLRLHTPTCWRLLCKQPGRTQLAQDCCFQRVPCHSSGAALGDTVQAGGLT